MDFSQFDVRTNSEKGAFCQFEHTHEHYLLFDGEETKENRVGAIVRGNASREAQRIVREMQAAKFAEEARKKAKKKDSGGEKTEEEELEEAEAEAQNFIEDLHESSVESAFPMIIELIRVEIPEDPYETDPEKRKLVSVGRDPELIRRFLDMCPPEIRAVRDEDGKLVRDEEGKIKMDIFNKPFALQIIEFAADQANYMEKR